MRPILAHSPASSTGPLPYVPELGDLRRSRRAMMSTHSLELPSPVTSHRPEHDAVAADDDSVRSEYRPAIGEVLGRHPQTDHGAFPGTSHRSTLETKAICTEPGSRLANPPVVVSGAEGSRP